MAQAANISVDYYTRLEQNRVGRVSDDVLEALARALRLDEGGSSHLRDLARTLHSGGPAHGSSSTRGVPTGLRAVLDAITAPAVLYGPLGDVLAWNPLGGHLYLDLGAEVEPNYPRLLFLDPRMAEAVVQYDDEARATVAHLRAQAGRRPNDVALRALVDALLAGSDLFARLWGEQEVHERDSGTKTIRNPLVGVLALDYQILRLADPDMTLFVYTARGADTRRRLDELARTLRGEPR